MEHRMNTDEENHKGHEECKRKRPNTNSFPPFVFFVSFVIVVCIAFIRV